MQDSPLDQSKPDLPQPTAPCDPEPVHSVVLAISLRDMTQRLASVEEKFDKDRNAKPTKAPFLIELFKVIFGGWPILGFVFLFLFYAPLRDALNAIPEKVKMASEIGALGVSLKSTVQNEAVKLGAGNLSETLPRLSGAAIELLLRAPRNSESLVSSYEYYDYYDGDDSNSNTSSERIEFPSSSEIDALSELEVQGLIELETRQEKITGNEARKVIDQFIKTHPGRELRSTRYGRMLWEPAKRLGENEYPPPLTWELSDLGKKAVEVILRAVSTELAPRPSPKHSP